MKICGGVEMGGTKVICGVGTGPGDLETIRFATTTPEETLRRVSGFFQERGVEAIGVGAFGPVDPDPASMKYGFISSTPKAGWRDVDVVGALRGLGVPVAFETDVNTAAMGEAEWGAGIGVGDLLYVTVGTGVGGGVLVGGQPVHGLMHPELGHVRIPRGADGFAGSCPFHGDCLEGLVSGTAIAARCGRRAEEVGEQDPVWGLVAEYLGKALMNWVLTLSPRRVILGGGVMQRAGLLERAGVELAGQMNGYARLPDLAPPGLGERSGVLGALAMARRVLVRKA
jgi:fructokinase